MKKTALLVAAAMLTLSGCVSTSKMMVDPNTGNTQDCSAFGFGYIGVPLALIMQSECEEKFKKMGMVDAKEYQKSGGKLAVPAAGNVGFLKMDSDPVGAEIYAGPTPDDTKTKIGVTPMEIKNPSPSGLWAKECFKMTKEGFFDSEPSCFDPVDGDRIVHFKLTAKK